MRLVPAFDQYVVAAPRDERACPAPERVYRPGGWFSPVLLVDGVMAGVWELEDDVVTIEPFGALGKRPCVSAAETEAARLPGTMSTGRANLRARRHSSPSPRPTAPAGAASAPPLARSASASSSSTARSRPRSPTACRPARRRARPRRVARGRDRPPRLGVRAAARSWRARWSRRACSPARTTAARPRADPRAPPTSGAVILGRAGAVILRDDPDALHVRLDGPPERRVEQAMEIEEPRPRRRRAPAQRRRPGARGLRAPLLRLRRTRPRALPPRDRLDGALPGDRRRRDRRRRLRAEERADHRPRERVEREVEADERR